MKKLLCTLIFATLGTAVAKADDITITFDQANQTTVAGSTIEFFGTITNNTGTTIFLNTDSLNLTGASLTTIDQFFNTVPISLDPGATSTDIELFDVTVSDPLADAAGVYLGTYTLQGGADGGDGSAQDNLGSASFSVTTVPEPSSIYLVLGGLSTLAPIFRKMRPRI
jgi:hypothetical protein